MQQRFTRKWKLMTKMIKIKALYMPIIYCLLLKFMVWWNWIFEIKLILLESWQNEKHHLVWWETGVINFHIPHDKTGMTEEQFNNLWDQIFQLLADLGSDTSMLIVANSREDLNIEHKKCFKDIFFRLDSLKGRLELLFLLSFICCLSRKIENEWLTKLS